MRSHPGFAIRRLENSVNPAVNGCLIRIRKGERDGFRLSLAVTKIQRATNPIVPTAFRQRETVAFTCLGKSS